MGTVNWAKLGYSRNDVDRAGRTLIDKDATEIDQTRALDVLNNLRSSHSFPLNTLQMNLRHKARSVDPKALVAQRLKRVASIVEKLRRFTTMNLSQMQDTGGCRAIVKNVSSVRRLTEAFLAPRTRHVLRTHKDYIAEPRESGYRSVHLVYQYQSSHNETYNNHQIEIQLRSRLQHAWATAVETVGTFLGQALKASEGSDRWLRFFTLTSSAFAEAEATSPVPGTPRGKQLFGKIRREADALRVVEKLNAYRIALKTIEEHAHVEDQYFLLSLRPEEGLVEIFTYRDDALDEAADHYLELEKRYIESPGAQAVLVRAQSTQALRAAFPNYFLNTQAFLDQLTKMTVR